MYKAPKIKLNGKITPKIHIKLKKRIKQPMVDNGITQPSENNFQNRTPTLYELKFILAEYLERGVDIEEVIKICNVSKRTLGLLRSDPEFDEFIQKCQAECEYDHIKAIHEAGKDGLWKASAWWLERTNPEKFGKVDKVKHEYELKLSNFKSIIVDVINGLDTATKNLIMQKIKERVNSGQMLSQTIDADYKEIPLLEVDGNV